MSMIHTLFGSGYDSCYKKLNLKKQTCYEKNITTINCDSAKCTNEYC